MNMTDLSVTSLAQAFDAITAEAEKEGVEVLGSEVVGLLPLEAVLDAARARLRLANVSREQVLEARLWE
jgi:glutamate formiminotransferase